MATKFHNKLSATKAGHHDSGTSSAGSSSDEREDVQVVPVLLHPERKRGAVSSEVPSKDPAGFKPPHFSKTPDQASRIGSVIKRSFLFSTLDTKDFDTVVNAFHEKHVKRDEILIRQGEDGNCLYLVELGSFDVIKVLPGDTKPTHVNIMTAGQVVGELALMYCCPRAATVTAIEDSVVWELDRDTFSNVVRTSAMTKRDRHTEFLKRVPLLRALSDYDRSQLIDALDCKEFNPGELIVREGDEGHTFYILNSGSAQALKNGKPVMIYNPGDYFGELALLRNKPRAASVQITDDGPATCLVLQRDAFVRLLGPLEDIMKRDAGMYSDVPLDERIGT